MKLTDRSSAYEQVLFINDLSREITRHIVDYETHFINFRLIDRDLIFEEVKRTVIHMLEIDNFDELKCEAEKTAKKKQRFF